MTAPLFRTRSSTSHSEGRWASPSVSRGATARLTIILVSVGIDGLGSDMLGLIKGISHLSQPVETSDLAAAVYHADAAAKIPPQLLIYRRFPPVHCRTQTAITYRRHQVEEYSGHVHARSEEHTSELQSLTNLVCR